MAAPKGNKFAEGNEGGRPTKYKPEYNEQAYKLCLLRHTDEELAEFFEVDESTINNWKVEHEEFLESIRAGKRKADMEVATNLLEGTKDRVVVETQAIKLKDVVYADGKKVSETERVQIVEVERVIPSDFRNQQFWLKNRQSDRWKDKHEYSHDVKNSNPVGNLDADELNALLALQNKANA